MRYTKFALIIVQMKNTPDRNKKTYKYNSYTNVKAVIDFLEKKGKKESDLNAYDVWLLSYLISLFTKENTLEKRIIEGRKFVFISDSLIQDNLKFSPGERQLKNVVRKLENFGFISRHIENKKKRFLSIDKEFLKLWRVSEWTMNPTAFLMKYDPERYKYIYNRFKPILKNYNDLIDRFNDNYDMEDKDYEVSAIGKQLWAYLEACSK